MKKSSAFFLTVCMIFSLLSCGKTPNSQMTSTPSDGSQTDNIIEITPPEEDGSVPSDSNPPSDETTDTDTETNTKPDTDTNTNPDQDPEPDPDPNIETYIPATPAEVSFDLTKEKETDDVGRIFVLSDDGNYYIFCGVETERLAGSGVVVYQIKSENKDVVIPSMYNGKPVKMIANHAFAAVIDLKNVTVSEGINVIGNCAFYGSSLTNIVIADSVTDIGEAAFCSCYSLPEIRLPKNLTAIGNEVFYFCDSLKSITLPEECPNFTIVDNCALYSADMRGLLLYFGKDSQYTVPNTVTTIWDYCFSQNQTLKEINLPDSLQIIGNYAFSYCLQLENIKLPENLRVIGNQAFRQCSKLKSLPIPLSVHSIGNGAFASTAITEMIIPETVTSMGEELFNGCSQLTTVSIPSYLTCISKGMFYGCSQLETVSIPQNVTSIEKAAFANCSKLTEITLPQALISIGENSFNGCKSLSTIKIPQNVTSIEKGAFANCSNLIEISIPKSVQTIGDEAFSYCENLKKAYLADGNYLLGKKLFYKCPSLSQFTVNSDCLSHTSDQDGNLLTKDQSILIWAASFHTEYTLNKHVVQIGEYAFTNCQSLSSIIFTNTVQSIGESAFSSLKELKNISFTDSITAIEDSAFYGCEGLTSITLPKNLQIVKNAVFFRCTSLENIVFPDNLTKICQNAFAYTAIKNLILPDDLTEIESLAFQQTNITSVHISKNLVSLDSKSFGGPFFTVDDENPVYMADSYGVLYSKDKKTLIKAPNNIKQYTVLNETEVIGENAFSNSSIYKLILSPNTTTVHAAFYNCQYFDSILIPKSVVSLDFSYFTSYQRNLHIYCEAESRPETWQGNPENNQRIKIYWGGTWKRQGYSFLIL